MGGKGRMKEIRGQVIRSVDNLFRLPWGKGELEENGGDEQYV